jgi:hypothetical protein
MSAEEMLGWVDAGAAGASSGDIYAVLDRG